MTNIIIYHTQVKKHRIPHKSWKRIFALLRTAVQWVEASVLLDESWAQTPSKLLTHQTQDTTCFAKTMSCLRDCALRTRFISY